MVEIVRAEPDPRLRAHVEACWPLWYRQGADPGLDRPAHVRAGSSLAQMGSFLLVVQDDAAFVAIVDPAAVPTPEGALQVDALTLPAGPDGVRQFDDLRGNKAAKLDLEACVTRLQPGRADLWCFGSGSSPRRERVVVVEGVDYGGVGVRTVDARALYQQLRACTDFSGSELNVEGAVILGDRLRLFQRGNGAPRGAQQPVDATCDLPLGPLVRALDGDGPWPAPTAVRRYDLGQLGGVRLGFTDAAADGAGGFWYVAAAEASPDAVADGPVAGVAIGHVDVAGRARWCPLYDAAGHLFTGKAEGLALQPHEPGVAWLVLDRDDPALPAELCRVACSGPWRGDAD